ncbi:uro-adherence factor A [Amia ocellicauda]|uniref:uro-adherence factor A n=1 Tax=Amia ocellicauda TaxID=2972642 RepID=UPI0034644EA0
MDPPPSPLSRVGQTFWAVLGYVVDTIGRIFKTEPAIQSDEDVPQTSEDTGSDPASEKMSEAFDNGQAEGEPEWPEFADALLLSAATNTERKNLEDAFSFETHQGIKTSRGHQGDGIEDNGSHPGNKWEGGEILETIAISRCHEARWDAEDLSLEEDNTALEFRVHRVSEGVCADEGESKNYVFAAQAVEKRESPEGNVESTSWRRLSKLPSSDNKANEKHSCLITAEPQQKRDPMEETVEHTASQSHTASTETTPLSPTEKNRVHSFSAEKTEESLESTASATRIKAPGETTIIFTPSPLPGSKVEEKEREERDIDLLSHSAKNDEELIPAGILLSDEKQDQLTSADETIIKEEIEVSFTPGLAEAGLKQTPHHFTEEEIEDGQEVENVTCQEEEQEQLDLVNMSEANDGLEILEKEQTAAFESNRVIGDQVEFEASIHTLRSQEEHHQLTTETDSSVNAKCLTQSVTHVLGKAALGLTHFTEGVTSEEASEPRDSKVMVPTAGNEQDQLSTDNKDIQEEDEDEEKEEVTHNLSVQHVGPRAVTRDLQSQEEQDTETDHVVKDELKVPEELTTAADITNSETEDLVQNESKTYSLGFKEDQHQLAMQLDSDYEEEDNISVTSGLDEDTLPQTSCHSTDEGQDEKGGEFPNLEAVNLRKYDIGTVSLGFQEKQEQLDMESESDAKDKLETHKEGPISVEVTESVTVLCMKNESETYCLESKEEQDQSTTGVEQDTEEVTLEKTVDHSEGGEPTHTPTTQHVESVPHDESQQEQNQTNTETEMKYADEEVKEEYEEIEGGGQVIHKLNVAHVESNEARELLVQYQWTTETKSDSKEADMTFTAKSIQDITTKKEHKELTGDGVVIESDQETSERKTDSGEEITSTETIDHKETLDTVQSETVLAGVLSKQEQDSVMSRLEFDLKDELLDVVASDSEEDSSGSETRDIKHFVEPKTVTQTVHKDEQTQLAKDLESNISIEYEEEHELITKRLNSDSTDEFRNLAPASLAEEHFPSTEITDQRPTQDTVKLVKLTSKTDSIESEEGQDQFTLGSEFDTKDKLMDVLLAPNEENVTSTETTEERHTPDSVPYVAVPSKIASEEEFNTALDLDVKDEETKLMSQLQADVMLPSTLDTIESEAESDRLGPVQEYDQLNTGADLEARAEIRDFLEAPVAQDITSTEITDLSNITESRIITFSAVSEQEQEQLITGLETHTKDELVRTYLPAGDVPSTTVAVESQTVTISLASGHNQEQLTTAPLSDTKDESNIEYTSVPIRLMSVENRNQQTTGVGELHEIPQEEGNIRNKTTDQMWIPPPMQSVTLADIIVSEEEQAQLTTMSDDELQAETDFTPTLDTVESQPKEEHGEVTMGLEFTALEPDTKDEPNNLFPVPPEKIPADQIHIMDRIESNIVTIGLGSEQEQEFSIIGIESKSRDELQEGGIDTSEDHIILTETTDHREALDAAQSVSEQEQDNVPTGLDLDYNYDISDMVEGASDEQQHFSSNEISEHGDVVDIVESKSVTDNLICENDQEQLTPVLEPDSKDDLNGEYNTLTVSLGDEGYELMSGGAESFTTECLDLLAGMSGGYTTRTETADHKQNVDMVEPLSRTGTIVSEDEQDPLISEAEYSTKDEIQDWITAPSGEDAICVQATVQGQDLDDVEHESMTDNVISLEVKPELPSLATPSSLEPVVKQEGLMSEAAVDRERATEEVEQVQGNKTEIGMGEMISKEVVGTEEGNILEQNESEKGEEEDGGGGGELIEINARIGIIRPAVEERGKMDRMMEEKEEEREIAVVQEATTGERQLGGEVEGQGGEVVGEREVEKEDEKEEDTSLISPEVREDEKEELEAKRGAVESKVEDTNLEGEREVTGAEAEEGESLDCGEQIKGEIKGFVGEEIEEEIEEEEEESSEQPQDTVECDSPYSPRLPAGLADLQVRTPVLDFSIQKSRIAVRNQQARRPLDPRNLLNKPSLPVSISPKSSIGIRLPGLASGLPVLRKTGEETGETQDTTKTTEGSAEDAPKEEVKTKWAPPGGVAAMGFKLPGLGAGLPVLRKTDRGGMGKESPENNNRSKDQMEAEEVKPKWALPGRIGVRLPVLGSEFPVLRKTERGGLREERGETERTTQNKAGVVEPTSGNSAAEGPQLEDATKEEIKPKWAPPGGIGTLGIKLPSLGTGLPVLRKTNRGLREECGETQNTTQEQSGEEEPMARGTADWGTHLRAAPESEVKPKWSPHGKAGSEALPPLNIAELKSKLRKTQKD